MDLCHDRKSVISASATGDIRLWDLSKSDSVKKFHMNHGLTAFDIHPLAGLYAGGSAQQCISVMAPNGAMLNTIKYHEGFMGQRIGPISCLAFHPQSVSFYSNLLVPFAKQIFK